jgi:predicted RNA-binding Zn ribbon-like protein
VSRDLERIPAEPEAELLVAFVNTRDVEEGTDAIGEPRALAAWAADNVEDLGRPDPDPSGHARLLAVRESLRALLRANNGGEATAGELAPLREAAARSRFRGSLEADDRLAIEPAGAGLEALEGRLLLAVERLQMLGSWERLKVCPADDCQWAFYDASRNHSRTWCSMEECGNRAKTRRYRRRKGSA